MIESRKWKFKVHYINRKTRSIDMTATCTTKEMDAEGAMRNVQDELSNIPSKYDRAYEFVGAWPKPKDQDDR